MLRWSAATVVMATLLAGGPAPSAAIYRWVDTSGQVHYTDDPTTIPPKYRAVFRKTQGEDLAVLSVETPPSTPSDGSASREQLWRSRFRGAREKVARIEEAVRTDRELLEQARRELAELDRQASDEAVPREWRR